MTPATMTAPATAAPTARPIAAELDHDPIRDIPTDAIRPSPENAKLYGPVHRGATDIRDLAASISENGIRDPLVLTADGWIVSGHRRYTAACLVGLGVVPCRVLDVRRADLTPDQYIVLLRDYNRQRVKTVAELARESLVDAAADDGADAYEELVLHRREAAEIDVPTLAIGGRQVRAEISAAKEPFLAAIMVVLEERRKFWPLSDRQIHYALLNCPPLIHASKARKPGSRYGNNPASYKALVDLLTRGRLAGLVPMQAIADETRPVSKWNVFPNVQDYIRAEMDGFLKTYWRDLLQSQPNHVELAVEKNTVAGILRPVASDLCLPMTSTRGYCSLPPRAAMVRRYLDSGKDKLVLLIVSDFDPDGLGLAKALAQSLRDDFGVQRLEPVRLALTAEQVQARDLPPAMDAKKTSTRYAAWKRTYGNAGCYELEALPPDDLVEIVRDGILSVLDVSLLNQEQAAERADATVLTDLRRRVLAAMEAQP